MTTMMMTHPRCNIIIVVLFPLCLMLNDEIYLSIVACCHGQQNIYCKFVNISLEAVKYFPDSSLQEEYHIL